MFFSIVWSLDESHDMMPSSPVVELLVVIHTEVGPGVEPGSALACARGRDSALKYEGEFVTSGLEEADSSERKLRHSATVVVSVVIAGCFRLG